MERFFNTFWGMIACIAAMSFIVSLTTNAVYDSIRESRVVECDMCGFKDERREMRDVCGYLLCPHCRHYTAAVAANARWFIENVKLEDIEGE